MSNRFFFKESLDTAIISLQVDILGLSLSHLRFWLQLRLTYGSVHIYNFLTLVIPFVQLTIRERCCLHLENNIAYIDSWYFFQSFNNLHNNADEQVHKFSNEEQFCAKPKLMYWE